MYRISFDAVDAIEKEAFKLEKLSRVGLAVENAIMYGPSKASEYEYAVSHLVDQMKEITEALYGIIRQRENEESASPAATDEAPTIPKDQHPHC